MNLQPLKNDRLRLCTYVMYYFTLMKSRVILVTFLDLFSYFLYKTKRFNEMPPSFFSVEKDWKPFFGTKEFNKENDKEKNSRNIFHFSTFFYLSKSKRRTQLTRHFVISHITTFQQIKKGTTLSSIWTKTILHIFAMLYLRPSLSSCDWIFCKRSQTDILYTISFR